MAVKRNQNCGVGEVVPATSTRSCHICYGNWDVPMPVKNKGGHFRYENQPFLPDSRGLGVCWDCFDKRKGFNNA